ncbi:MAG: hypothetical protein JWL97_3808 [Gemmatimonadales bacterium]|nr:hypothetical protein [Gemmatimonadales bacterium]
MTEKGTQMIDPQPTESRIPRRLAKVLMVLMCGWYFVEAVDHAQKFLALGKGDCQCGEAAEEPAQEEAPDEAPPADR